MTEGKIVDYALVVAIQFESLEQLVTERLKQGWEPHGSTVVHAPAGDFPRICQSMVKRGPSTISNQRFINWDEKIQKKIEGLDEAAHKTFTDMISALQASRFAFGVVRNPDGEHHYNRSLNGRFVMLTFIEDADTVKITSVNSTPSQYELTR